MSCENISWYLLKFLYDLFLLLSLNICCVFRIGKVLWHSFHKAQIINGYEIWSWKLLDSIHNFDKTSHVILSKLSLMMPKILIKLHWDNKSGIGVSPQSSYFSSQAPKRSYFIASIMPQFIKILFPLTQPWLFLHFLPIIPLHRVSLLGMLMFEWFYLLD